MSTAGTLEDSLTSRLKQYLGDDQRRIAHALKVTQRAKEILKQERGADEVVVLCAAILHDIGIHEAEKKYGSSSPRYQHLEGPPVAREILKQEGLPDAVVEEVCDIVGHHHWPRPHESINFKIVYDADQIVGVEEGELSQIRLLTQGGRRLARQLGLQSRTLPEEQDEC